MSWSLLTNEWRLKVLAFALGILMLGAVAFSQNPPTSKTIQVPLSYTVPPNIVLINPPTTTPVTVSGLADVVARANATNTVAGADATRALPGSGVKLNVTAHSLLGGNQVTVQTPPPIAVQVDTLQALDIPVQVNASAAAGWSITVAKAVCPGNQPNPCTVHFDGPASWETNLTATVAVAGFVNYTGPQDTPNLQVQLHNSRGLLDLTTAPPTIPQASVSPNSVGIHIEAKPGSTFSTVALVDAAPSHGPPSGYRVTGVTITPATVVLNGDPGALGKIQRITLPPVDLSNSTSDATFQVAVNYPSGVTGSVANATVTYSISKNPNVSPGP